ncbi:DUF551 domain-containing protein [Mixta calida]|uniref:DUF551 domain-containing protein n=1 Tax=Mixta calida TaxID=665913 RepID=UPI003CEA9AA2
MWIKCSERMPLELSDELPSRFLEVIVTDGCLVGKSECQAGWLPHPWVGFSCWGDIEPSKITHWQPLPSPPEEE